MKCRHCAASLQMSFLDLGSAPPSNAYLDATALDAPEVWYPLRLLVCTQCWLVQTEDYAGREALFASDYGYFSAVSSSWLAHARQFVQEALPRFALGAGSMVVEVAANDGYLLQYVRDAEVPCYGIEPTALTAAAARARGISIIERFFGVELARQLVVEGRQADLMVANNVLAHVPDINDFVAGFAQLLKPAGVASFEFPHLLEMVRGKQFDTAYHEHYSYLSLHSVQRVLHGGGMQVFDVQQLSTHGGSLRVFAQRADTGVRVVTAEVARLLALESDSGMQSAGFYRGFQDQAHHIKWELLEFLLRCKREGLSVAAYGAAAKGNTLLNFAGVRADLLSYVVDRSPGKLGRYLPGSRIPVRDVAHLLAHRPDRVLILPWNLKSEVMAQLPQVTQWGGRFVTAVPMLELLLA